MAQSFLFSHNMFVWVDEMGTDNRDHIRKYGYAFRGMTPTCTRHFARGKRTNATVGLSSSGVVASEIINASVNGDAFFTLFVVIFCP